MTKTAKKLFISPSSLSMTIARLEKELETQLFTRAGRNIVLNETGRLFADNVRASLNGLDFAVKQVKLKRSITLLLDTPDIWSKTLSGYMESQPGICINTKTMQKKSISPDLLAREFDFWLSKSWAPDSGLKNCDQLEHRVLTHNSRIYLAVPDDHPLASRSSVSVRELSGEAFLMPVRGYEYYDTCMNFCHGAGFEPRVVANCGFFLRMQMLSAGAGIAFVNDRYEELFKHITILNLEEVNTLQANETVIFWHKDKEQRDETRSFLKYITMYYQE